MQGVGCSNHLAPTNTVLTVFKNIDGIYFFFSFWYFVAYILRVYEPLTLSFGVLSVLLVTAINSLLKMSVDSKGSFSYKNFFIFYLPWILKEIVVSGIKTSGAILGFRKFKSNAKKIKVSQRTSLGTVIYGNSITLTPGTLTIEVDQDNLFVHALCDSSLNELEVGEMDKRVSDLEK